MEKFSWDGVEAWAGELDLFGVKILLICTGRGALGCGYLNLAAAEKFGHALAIVSGVASYEEMLDAPVRAVSPAAAALGVAPGDPGREALKKMR